MSLFPRVFTSAILITGILTWGIKAANLIIYHGSLNNYTSTPLEEPLKLLPYFNKSRVSMFYSFGFNETPNSADTVLILSAFLKMNYTNVLLVDWSKEASQVIVADLSYALKAVPFARLVGYQFGQALLTLMGKGIDPNKMHLVGHSLGAQLSGFAGERTVQEGRYVARISGLDPAGPCFEGLINNNGLNRFRAKFVDILHTNPRLYGVNDSIGTVDFWANCRSPLQPGCPEDNSDSEASFCSHQRSCKIFNEAILYPKSFPAAQAACCASWGRNDCEKIIYLGDAVDTSARGNYYFTTNSEYPYSKGKNGTAPDN